MFSTIIRYEVVATGTETIVEEVGTWTGGRGVIRANQANASTDWNVTLIWNGKKVITVQDDVGHFDLPTGIIGLLFKENGGIDAADINAIITSVTALTQAP